MLLFFQITGMSAIFSVIYKICSSLDLFFFLQIDAMAVLLAVGGGVKHGVLPAGLQQAHPLLRVPEDHQH